MNQKKIIVIETSDIGARYTGMAIRNLGFDPLFLISLKNYQSDTLNQIQEFDYVDMDTTSVSSMLDFIHQKNWSIEGITTFLDSRLHLAVELSEALNVRGLDPKIRAFKDKGAVDSLGAQLSPPAICFNKSAIPVQKIESLRRQYGTVIFKPRCTAGGVGVYIVNAIQPAEKYIQYVQNFQIPNHLQPDEWMAQAYISGELVSVEGFIRNGETQILGCTGRRKILNTESWAGFPYQQNLTIAAKDQAYKKTFDLVNASKIQNAFFHVELIVNQKEAFVIDANLGRLGGGGVGEILSSAYHVSPVDIFTEVLKITLFPEKEIANFWSNKPQMSVSVAYGLKFEASLLDLNSRSKKDVFNTQILDFGCVVPAMGKDNWSWVGIVSGSPSSVSNYLESITMVTSLGDQKAFYALPTESI